MKKYVKVSILSLILLHSIFAIAQNRVPAQKKNTCTTFVYNLNTEEMKIRDICFEISKTDHIDLNEFSTSSSRDRTKDHWKFHIKIVDNEKLTQQSFDASFFIYEESSEIIQYHCIVENIDIKAIIYEKLKERWQILILQNDIYKMLSSYSGYHYTNAFDIKPIKKSSIEY